MPGKKPHSLIVLMTAPKVSLTLVFFKAQRSNLKTLPCLVSSATS